mmetsp:Transcript_9203/g.14146  ORF Transcript_9203/g.14146 Transcript_9203/m.14146 type:complete len:538 (+) Transcript_9203:169-1782(+)
MHECAEPDLRVTSRICPNMCQTNESSLTEPLLPSNSSIYEEGANTTASDDNPPRSRNIRLTLIYTLLAFAGRSMWSQSVLSTFVFLLRHNNAEAVGFITAAMGISQLIVSFPVGYLADRYRRDTMLKLASVIGFCSICLVYVAILKDSYVWLTFALSVWGAFWGTTNTSLGALYADSIPQGERSKYFMQRAMLVNTGTMAGPTTALILFALLGDEWTLKECGLVIAVGNTLCFPALVILCLFDDDVAEDGGSSEIVEESLIIPNSAVIDTSHSEMEDNVSDGDFGFLFEDWAIPFFIAAADVISGLGSGMSIRYFPIFFVTNLNLSPVYVQVLYILSSLGGIFFKYVAQRASKPWGRCRVTVFFKWISISLMVTMIVSYHFGWPTYFTCTLFVLRTSLMNSTTPLTKSLLMDVVPKENRAKWSAIESVSMFSWSGSAALGGILVGLKGILFNFSITAGIQFIATLPLLAIVWRDADKDECSSTNASMCRIPPQQMFSNSLIVQGNPSMQINEEESMSRHIIDSEGETTESKACQNTS